MDFEGYYLESEPCLGCSSPEAPYQRLKLDSLKAETKFTESRILIKCARPYSIKSLTMVVHDPRRSKSVRTLSLYYSPKAVAELSELKNKWEAWTKARVVHLAPSQAELKIDFPLPITACNLMVEFHDFHINLQAMSLESLQCPRCSR